MKIVVSTFNNSKNNYGAVFQSCALSSFLTDLGYEPYFTTINNRAKPKLSFKAKVKGFIINLLLLPHKKQTDKRTLKFKEFTKLTQNQIVYETGKDLHDNPPIADVYLSGSDQVWNPVSFHKDLFLSYAKKDAKLISYAASMGNENIPKQSEEKFAKYIKRYKHVSVREDTMIDIIKNYTNVDIHQNVDPVFLKSKKDWQKLQSPYKKLKFKKYILAYVINWNSTFNEQLKEIKRKTNLPVVCVNIGCVRNVCANQIVRDASPNEFLYLLDNAEMVVATSFHGLALSMVYNKKFIPFIGKDKPTRIQSLLRHFNVPLNVSFENFKVDYDLINNQILKDTETSKTYLTNAINN